MFEDRQYQTDAHNSIYEYFAKKDGNPLVVLPTGTGKSRVISMFVRSAMEQFPETRIVMLTHVRELIVQNFSALIRSWPEAPGGIYSAGLGKKDLSNPITFAGIQSIYRQAYKVQRCDLVLVDEAHLIPRNNSTMYGKFLADLKGINPHLKIIGFTATPYRMDSGMLHEGDDALFSDIAYEMTILEAIQQGYLAEVVPKRMETELDVSGVGTRGGEFIARDLERAVDIDAITESAVREIVEYGTGAHGNGERGSWLVFCAGVDHALHVRDAVRQKGFSAETVTGDTPKGRRDEILAAFKRGEIRCLTNMSVLTTGFDAPGVDLIAALRPTKSPGLWVQMLGRGTRLANGKENCLLLDFAGNTKRHGPIDKIKVSDKRGSGDGEAPVKECPDCHTLCYAGVRACPECGFEFPPPEPELKARAATDAVLSTQIKDTIVDVTDVSYHLHEKLGKPPSLRVDYQCGQFKTHREWVCLEHTGFPRQKACQWWARRAPGQFVPMKITEALDACAALPKPKRIIIRPEGKYTSITGYQF